MERYFFADGAMSSKHFLQAILAPYKRLQWDRSVVDLRVVAPIVDKNLLLVEELSQQLVPGLDERLAFMKRFVFQAHGCFFVYSSSVPPQTV